MKKYFFILLIGIFAWAPWISDTFAREKASATKNFQEQHQRLPFKSEIYIHWVPFGKWVTTVEGGWFVAFWGGVV